VKPEYDAIAFDLDGTLYPNYRLYVRLIPFIIKEHRLLRAMGKARDTLRAAAQEGRFYDIQARIMADILRGDPTSVQERTEALIYRGWEPLFRGVRLFDGVRETLDAFKSAGLKLGMLVPEQLFLGGGNFSGSNRFGQTGLVTGLHFFLPVRLHFIHDRLDIGLFKPEFLHKFSHQRRIF